VYQADLYVKAVEIFEAVALASLSNNLLKYSVKSYLLNAGLCQLCRNDPVALSNALDRYQEMDPTFIDTRECKFLQVRDAYTTGDAVDTSEDRGRACGPTGCTGKQRDSQYTNNSSFSPGYARVSGRANTRCWVLRGTGVLWETISCRKAAPLTHPLAHSQELAAATEEGDATAFTNVVAEFDAMSKLDAWKTRVLLTAKRLVTARENGGEDLC
jgi:hypothetical protein